jgi:nitrogen fixation protein FixH
MSEKSNGRVWPYAIVLSILFIAGASIATVVIAVNNPVEMSDLDMQGYHHYDANANDIIGAKIAFDKKYTVDYVSKELNQDNAVIAYKVSHKDGKGINDAKINIMVTRPDNHKSDIAFDNAKIDNGVYTFEVGKLPLAGRWDIMAHVVVGENEKYFSLKADTRHPNVFEY